MKTPLTLLVLVLLPLATAVQSRLDAPLTQVAAQTRQKSAAPPPGLSELAPPPIKMGLWKSTSVATIAGMQIPPEVAARMKAMGRSLGQTQTVNTLSCITPEKWKQIFNRQRDQRCQLSNLQQSSASMSADITCSSSRGSNSTGHMQMTFDSDTKMHGTFHMNVASEHQPQPMTIDTTYQGEYQGADCQGISPDSPKVIQ